MNDDDTMVVAVCRWCDVPERYTVVASADWGIRHPICDACCSSVRGDIVRQPMVSRDTLNPTGERG